MSVIVWSNSTYNEFRLITHENYWILVYFNNTKIHSYQKLAPIHEGKLRQYIKSFETSMKFALKFSCQILDRMFVPFYGIKEQKFESTHEDVTTRRQIAPLGPWHVVGRWSEEISEHYGQPIDWWTLYCDHLALFYALQCHQWEMPNLLYGENASKCIILS